ncbi:Putative phosphoserine phosphatase 2 [Paenibacillus konkukensis]|uniref:Phosphoserine phosphatase 2 n=1 Tax=Paenibacillus konkukensis TaxID=2020716 RepID=A0ABY4S1B8_9BACL|nr:histidine phosphatase family protein [Paenibacillus konkukensis]UQZ87559.1 Putative phosphoserine phosphatase 2 [Paenibacillus konkukensis]
MKIILARHGEDESGYRGGWSPRGLTADGILQSRKLGAYLARHQAVFNINTIVSSDLQRAMETAREAAAELKLPVIYSSAWREMNNGLLAGMPNPEAERRFPGVYFNTLRMDEPFPEGESPQQFYTRIRGAFEHLLSRLEQAELEANVLVVTHGGVINVIYYLLSRLDWTNKAPFHSAGSTGLHIVERTEEGWTITGRNDRKELIHI